MLPDDHLSPIWRCEPNHGSGVFTVALDPREAEFVLSRGWATLDGVRYRVNLNGFNGTIDGDGRIAVRCQIDDAESAAELLAQDEARRRSAHHPYLQAVA